jgi:universal stress protein E
MDRLQSVLVGIDFTPCSKAALAQAVRIAQWNRATLRAVHVIETLVVTDLEEAIGGHDPQLRQNIVEDTRAAWRTFAAEVPGAESIELDIRVDYPADALAAAAKEHGADLVVLGAYGTSRGSGAGMLATHAVRKSPAKVLLVRENNIGKFRSVVVAVDFSNTSREALESAMRVAAQDASEVHVLHVFNPPWMKLHYRAATPEATADFRKQFLDGLERRLREFSNPSDPETRWTKPTFQVMDHRSHGAGIVEYARSVQADLVVLGTRGRTNLRDLLLGSTAERVVRDADCAILAIRPEA